MRMSMAAEELGAFREMVKVHITGATEPLLIDVSAQVVMHKINLLYPNGEGTIDTIDIGNMCFGQEKEINALLVNNGPTPVGFNVLFPDDEEKENPESEYQVPGSKFVTIEPMEGVIRAYAQIPVKIFARPIAPAPEKGFTKQFLGTLHQAMPLSCRPLIDVPEVGVKVNFNIAGFVSMPKFHISPRTLRFGECGVSDRRDILVTFENKLPTDLNYEVRCPAHFKFSPSKGTVYGNQRQTFIVSFLPTQMGKLKHRAYIVLEKGVLRLRSV